jgi:aldehyde:ferredoxin oxidoreductase
MLGSNCGISSLDEIAQMNYLCNDYGLDTIEVGATLAVAMEANVLQFGDSERAKELIAEIGHGQTFLGRILGSGTYLAGKVLGVKRIPACRGQALAAYDPRAFKGMGVLYATCTMGADHTLGSTLRATIDQKKPEGQVALSKGLQIENTFFDILGLCLFLKGSIISEKGLMMQLLKSKTGITLDFEEGLNLSKELIKLEKEFNEKAGLNFRRHLLPEFFSQEECPPFNVRFDVAQAEMDAFYENF